MLWKTPTSSDQEVKDLQCTVNDGEMKLTWYWPKNIEFVYMLIAPVAKWEEIEENSVSNMKLYTREEYKAKQGYHERMDSIGKYAVRIFPCLKEGEELTILKQENDLNLVHFSTGRAKIYYSINYKKKLLQARKKVKMSIMSEITIERAVLCYVKKEGAVPVSIDDGTIYPFIRDFQAGETVLPEIEIEKNEFMRIFIQDRKFAEIYELIPK